MDPLSQGVVGMSASQTLAKQKHLFSASIIGFLSGMAADLDVFIRSDTDPLLFLEFHRQFTHSLIFMPVGGLICAIVFTLILKGFKKTNLSFLQIYLFSTIGYATHALLDSCTSYGTQLFWPFSNERIAWNNISIIDPLFTLPLLILVLTAMFKRSKRWSYVGAAYAIAYLGLGLIQEQRAHTAAEQLAQLRGHTPLNLNLKPSFANLLVWKSIYEYKGRYYVDGIRVVAKSTYYPGTSTNKLELKHDLPWLNINSQQAKDIERFRWFSSDHLAMDRHVPNRIIDMRYSMLPNTLDGLWGIQLSPAALETDHIKWTTNRNVLKRKQSLLKLWKMIQGQDALSLEKLTPLQ